MARQTINVGTIANDGTGDSLRTAAVKMNSNFVELYNANTTLASVATSGSYNDLLNTPSIPADITDLTDTTNKLVPQFNRDYTVSQDSLYSIGGVNLNLLNVYSAALRASNTNLSITSDQQILIQGGGNVNLNSPSDITLNSPTVTTNGIINGSGATFTGPVSSQDGSEFISITYLKNIVSLSADFSDFQTRVAAL